MGTGGGECEGGRWAFPGEETIGVGTGGGGCEEGGGHFQGRRPQGQKSTSRRPWCGLRRRWLQRTGSSEEEEGVGRRRLLNAAWEVWIFSFRQWEWVCL